MKPVLCPSTYVLVEKKKVTSNATSLCMASTIAYPSIAGPIMVNIREISNSACTAYGSDAENMIENEFESTMFCFFVCHYESGM